MRSLDKAIEPKWLVEHSARLTADYLAANDKSGLTPWRNAEVIDALRRECRGKCIYCEARPGDVSFPNVEHIKPKATFPALVVSWDNLGFACARCNTTKGSYWSSHADLRLLNPYEDDVESLIEWAGTIALPAHGSRRAANTIAKLRIARSADQFEVRSRAIDNLETVLEQWYAATDSEVRAFFAEEVNRLLGDDEEYCSMLRAHAALRGFEV